MNWLLRGAAVGALLPLVAYGTAQAQEVTADEEDTAGQAVAEAAQNPETDERVLVTGSLIKGRPEDSALPVSVTTRGDLLDIGSPSLTEFIRNLGASSGIDGETNQFAANGLEGSSNVNLRGLGPARTLVLINGRRQVAQPFALAEQAQLFIDTNQIPVSAIGSIEILKEGAAATYGSDAVAGVVDFVTRTDLDGFEIGGDYSYIDGSNGDYSTFASYGRIWEDTRFFVTFGYQHRSELQTLDRDFAISDQDENPQGGFSSIGNPGTFIALSDFSFNPDVNCELVGGTAAPTACFFQFTQFDNLVEKTDRYQIFGDFEHTFSSGVTFRTDVLWAKTDVPEWKTSPSYPPQVLLGQIVLPDHPGLVQYIEDNPSEEVLANGAIFLGRAFGWGGFPGQGAQVGSRERASVRTSSSLTGDWRGMSWDFGVTYAASKSEVITPDTFIDRFANALVGLGGADCDPATGTPGAGPCEYYNPFSNAIEQGFINGTPNPQFRPELANSPQLADFVTGQQELRNFADLFVFDALISGEMPITLWSDAPVGWAAGAQYRRDSYESRPGPNSDITQRPCPTEGDFDCASPTGPFSFLAATTPFQADRDIYAFFGELAIPLTDTIDLQLAGRFEDYGGETGSTFDPKFGFRWQVFEQLALRGSVQTTFRAPTLNQLAGQATTLQFVAPTSAFKAVDQFGNADLEPETAFTYTIGAILERGGFRGSIDYWSFDFEDAIIVEPFDAIVNSCIADLEAGLPAEQSAICGRITFDGDPAPASIARIQTDIVNGPDIQTSGIDVSTQYVFENIGPGILTVATDSTYTLEYEVDDFFIEGVLAQPQFDGAGQMNRGNFLRSIPELKVSASLTYDLDIHNFSAIVRHVDSYTDERDFVTGDDQEIDSWTTLDLHYNVDLPYQMRFSLSALNVTDEDPPFARLDLNYDPFTHSPVGRIVRIGLIKSFGAE